MSAPTDQAMVGADPGAAPGGRRPRRGRRGLLVTAVVIVVLVVAGGVVGVIRPFGRAGGRPSPGVTDNGYPTSLATVTRRSLSQTTAVNATLDYAGNYTVPGQEAGTFTSLPAVGDVVRQGQVLYRVDGKPVVLLYGPVPVYRNMSEGMTGSDVTQLNHDLVRLGYADSASIASLGWDYFSWETKYAVEQLQAALGVTQNGTLALGQAVFLPGAARVTTVSATLGGAAGRGQPVLQATSTTREVTINLNASQQSEVKVGDRVTITLPDSATTPGVISYVGTVATTPSSSGGSNGSSTPTVTVEVRLTDPAAAGSLDQAPVEVSITSATVDNALVVPVGALLALSSGGYAVEVAGGGGVHHLVGVTVGIFDGTDGLVQVTGPGLAAGQRVVVPGT
jgi:hypothetical protein